MSDTVIQVQNLGKKYSIGSEPNGASGLRHLLNDLVTSPFRRIGNRQPGIRNLKSEPFWALRDVCFDVERGEALGIIGRNGAGKSTLLKILSRITEPTTGRVRLRGRAASLLEVGTGFHPELTGRENVFLNGAILGMSKAEITRKFDEIVAFAEVEKFLDTPVKRYSSGMYVRLAFAVAAHLEPEILIVDEVLAVGDAQFQKKCLGRMGEVGKEGRTVLFVSHNLVALQSLCKRAIWLEHGEAIKDGSSAVVVAGYLSGFLNGTGSREETWPEVSAAPGNEAVRLSGVRIRTEHGQPGDPITMQTPFAVEVDFWNLLPDARLHITLHLYTEQDVIAFTTGGGHDPDWNERTFPRGLYRTVCQIPGDLLNSGRHRFVILVVRDGNSVIYRHESSVMLEVADLRERTSGWYGKEPGVVQPSLQWSTKSLGDVSQNAGVR